MPHKCCVATCRGNYEKDGRKVSVFSFPSDPDLNKKWINSLKRKDDFKPTKHSKVCELHFRPEEICREVEYYDEKNSKLLKVPLSYPQLKKGTIPSQYPDGPKTLSSVASCSSSRESPRRKKVKLEADAVEKAIKESLKSNEDYIAERTYSTLTELRFYLQQVAPTNAWNIIYSSASIVFLNLQLEPLPDVVKSVTIDSDLNVCVHVKKIAIKTLGKYSFPCKISYANDLFDILKEIENLAINDYDKLPNYLDHITKVLEDIKDLIPERTTEISFLSEQISKLNVKKNQHRYSAELMIFSSLLYSISPHSYKFLRSSGNIIIPHPSTIHKICSKLSINPSTENFNDNFLAYVTQRRKDITEKESIVILMIDEIYLKPYFDFKGGNVCGMAYDTKNAATTAHVFMIRSLLSSFKEVAHILPVKTISGNDLYVYLNHIVIGLETAGYKVISIVTDNNSINRKAVSMFAMPPKLDIVYKHPVDPERPLFFIIDSVHIMKCIRNNWLNQKNINQCMYFPNFESLVPFHTASFSAIKKLHEIETAKLVKYGHGLTIKALFPTNLERQNVKLALQVFNPCVSEALLHLGEENNLLNYKDTSCYINIIYKWWSIVNVKTVFKGLHKREKFQEPLTVQPDDVKFKYLCQLNKWLDCWKGMNCSTGNLSKETHLALDHTTHGLIEMARYCIEKLHFDYFLPGKVQTDTLESRFGKYRQLSGSQHNVSIRQIYETETKLRLQSSLPILAKFGNIDISLKVDENYVDDVNMKETSTFLDKIFVHDIDIINVKDDLPLLTYIGGYCCYSVIKKLNCEACKLQLTINKDMVIDYESSNISWIKKFDRGGLLYPSPDVLNVVVYTYIVVQKLVSEEFETDFLSVSNQRNVVCVLTLHLLEESSFFLELEGCLSNHESLKVLKHLVQCLSNIFLNNYVKKKNDCRIPTINLSKQRKLKTLTK